MDGVTPSTKDTTIVPAGTFKKDGPWVIGMSIWRQRQTPGRTGGRMRPRLRPPRTPDIEKLIILDAGYDQEKKQSPTSRT